MKKLLLCVLFLGLACLVFAQEDDELVPNQEPVTIAGDENELVPNQEAVTIAGEEDEPVPNQEPVTTAGEENEPVPNQEAVTTAGEEAVELPAEPLVEKNSETEIAGEAEPAAANEVEPDIAMEETPRKPESKHWWEPFSAGLGIEANNNNPHGAALGGTLSLDYRFFRFFAAGLRGGLSSNFGYSNTFELAGTVNLVVPYKKLDFFLYGGIGMSSIFADETGESKLLLEGGGGVRVPIKIGPIVDYIEGSARFGTPFLWGAGVMVGKSFK
jgi:hypothetical protein